MPMPIDGISRRFFVCADDLELEIYNANFVRTVSNRNGINEENISIKGQVNTISFPIFESNKLKILDPNNVLNVEGVNIYITHCETSIQVGSFYGVSIDAIVDCRPDLVSVETTSIDYSQQTWIDIHTQDPYKEHLEQFKCPAAELYVEIPEKPKRLTNRRIDPESLK